MHENSTEFKHNDFYESCIVMAAGIPLKRIDPSNGKFLTFVFDDPQYQAENLIERHWSGELKQSTKEIIRCIHELKQRMYSVSKRNR